MFLVNAQAMRQLDSLAQKKGIMSAVLMENAAEATVFEILKLSPSSVIVFCGKGQNGGDGYAIARKLFIKGIDVTVCALFGEEVLRDSALINYNAFKNIGGKIIPFSEYINREFDVCVDCLLGTGAKGNVYGEIEKCINLINSMDSYVISADLPSGVCADTGEILGVAVKADKTVTYGFIKEGLYSPLSLDYVGEICLSDVSIPADMSVLSQVSTFLSEKKDITIPSSSKSAHKGTNGKVLIMGGSRGLCGAPLMAADAAGKMGAGLITLSVPEELMDIFMARSYTFMCKSFSECDFSSYDTVLIGNGMGTDRKNLPLIEKALNTTKGTLIIDADGLNLLAENTEILKNKNCEVILTPHPLEFSRLTGISTEEILRNRVSLSKKFAKEYSVTVILKTACTVVSLKSGSAYINSTGNEGMAKGGSGDVLAGMLAGAVHRYPDINSAALSVTYLHSLAGDIASKKKGIISMNAADIISCIPDALAQ